MPRVVVLTPEEIELLREGQQHPSLVTNYFFKKPGAEKGWIFDDNFRDQGKWQEHVCLAAQSDIVVDGGFGSGKTLGIGMGGWFWGMETNDFKFLNAAQTLWQSNLMFEKLMDWSKNTRAADLMTFYKAPYPKIIIRYKIGNELHESTMEFMSVDKNANAILGWEGDWLNIDEAAQIEDLEGTITNVGSRLRGTIQGRERLGRFSMTSNPWENWYFWYYFDMAASDPENYLSIVVSSRDNLNVTPNQLRRMLARIPEDQRERFIDGTRPEGRGHYFSKESVSACESQILNQITLENINQAGYAVRKVQGAGIVSWQLPPRKGHIYMLFGDPGIDDAPKRNAPVLMMWEIPDNFPSRCAQLANFWWGFGHSSIHPFVDKMFDLMDLYSPIATGIDSTGPQKNTAQLINEHLFRKRFERAQEAEDSEYRYGYVSPMGIVRGIQGMDFSGGQKVTYLISLRLLLEGTHLQWPQFIGGIRAQLTNYEYEEDKKIAQDIVACMSMSAFGIRRFFNVALEDMVAQNRSEALEGAVQGRKRIVARRTLRSYRR